MNTEALRTLVNDMLDPAAVARRQAEHRDRALSHADRNAHRAIGLPYRIRLSKSECVSGTIVACEGNGRGGWKITMECGINRTRREFNVTSIPVGGN